MKYRCQVNISMCYIYFMTFTAVQHRLLDHLRQMVERGETTESGLAETLDYSQPQVHNVLKGERGLTPDFADRGLEAFDIQLEALLPAPPQQDAPFRQARTFNTPLSP